MLLIGFVMMWGALTGFYAGNLIACHYEWAAPEFCPPQK